MGRLDGKVAVVSGAARGQGRSHAVTMAREGASIVAFDICAEMEATMCRPSTLADLEQTAKLVEAHDQRCITAKVDARDLPAMVSLADQAMVEFGHIDILAVNHGIWSIAENSWELEESAWQESIDVILTGAWKVTKAFIPRIIEGGPGGSVVLTASTNAYTPQPSAVAYCAAKAGVLNMMRVLSWELGEYGIRANAVCPGGVDTHMVTDGGLDKAQHMRPRYINSARNLLPAELLPPQSISDAVLYLVSDDSKHVTGTAITVDAGWTNF